MYWVSEAPKRCHNPGSTDLVWSRLRAETIRSHCQKKKWVRLWISNQKYNRKHILATLEALIDSLFFCTKALGISPAYLTAGSDTTHLLDWWGRFAALSQSSNPSVEMCFHQRCGGALLIYNVTCCHIVRMIGTKYNCGCKDCNTRKVWDHCAKQNIATAISLQKEIKPCRPPNQQT